MNLLELRRKVDSALADHRHAAASVASEAERLAESKLLVGICLEGQKILQEVAAAVQQAAHDQIAKVVSRCLEAVFEETYQFRITFEQKRGRTEAVLDLVRAGESYDPISAVGGGVVDVAAFGLRVAVLMVSVPRRRRFLSLDEPFRMVSDVYADRVRDMVLALSRELDIQILMITHDPSLACGHTVRL